MKELNEFCEEHFISRIPHEDHVGYVKMSPTKNNEIIRFFVMSIYSKDKWVLSVGDEDSKNKTRKIYLYMENDCDLSMVDAARIGMKVFEKGRR